MSDKVFLAPVFVLEKVPSIKGLEQLNQQKIKGIHFYTLHIVDI